MKIIAKLLLIVVLIMQPLLGHAVTVEQGTHLLINPKEEIDADDYKVGDQTKWTLVTPLKVDKQVVLQPGSTEVVGPVVKKKNNFIFGVSGSITVDNFKLKTGDNLLIPLQCSATMKGNSRVALALIGGYFLFFPIFVKGEDGIIPASHELSCYTLQEFSI